MHLFYRRLLWPNLLIHPNSRLGLLLIRCMEYLYRYEESSAMGVSGDSCRRGTLKKTHYPSVPTYTGPGHASIYTQTTPAVHGVISNDWYDKNLKKGVNCVATIVEPVGSETGNGDVSPGDALHHHQRRKSLSVSAVQGNRHVHEDRGAVLLAGHTPDGAFWFDGSTGHLYPARTISPGFLPGWRSSTH